MNPRALLLAMLLASPALAAAPAVRLLTHEEATPSTVPLLAPEAASLPYSFHLPPLKLQGAGDLTSPLPLPLPGVPDEGGGAGVSNDTIGILGILLALFVGFGTGHLIVRDRDGFILFLIVDIVILVVVNILHFTIAGGGFIWLGWGGLGWAAFLVSHLIQVLDVYGKAFGGGRLLDRARDSTLLIEPPGRAPDPALPSTQRLFRFSF